MLPDRNVLPHVESLEAVLAQRAKRVGLKRNSWDGRNVPVGWSSLNA